MSSCRVHTLGRLILAPHDFGLFGWTNLHQKQKHRFFLHVSVEAQNKYIDHLFYKTLKNAPRENITIAQ
jgi:hypothetical protein